MVAAMEERYDIDLERVFVTGLSAGGAMTAVMLATYPDVFAGGAVIAGLPFGTARSVPEALERMRGQGLPAPNALAALARSASGHTGPWPTLSVWHGTADRTVDPVNAQAVLDQWRGLHGLQGAAPEGDTVDGYPHRVWRDASGRAVIEEYSVTGMGHGTPLSASGENAGEASGPHMLEAGISSTRHIARFWGIADNVVRERPSSTETAIAALRHTSVSPTRDEQQGGPAAPAASGVQKTIEDALRAAGLLKL
jgi:poly(3-hydroxybutyrate) depolymerase